MAIVIREVTYCVLEEAEGLLVRQVLETLPIIESSESYSSESTTYIHLFDLYRQTKVWNEEEEEWEYPLELITVADSPGDKVITGILWDSMNNGEIIWSLFYDKLEALGFGQYSSEYYAWLESYGINRHGENWQYKDYYIFPSETDTYPRYIYHRKRWDFKAVDSGNNYDFSPDTTKYSNWLYNYFEGKYEYPYILHIETYKHNSFSPTDKELRESVNVGVRYIGEKVTKSYTLTSYYRENESESWKIWSEGTPSTITKHIWFTGYFWNDYEIQGNIGDRVINVLKDIDEVASEG